MLQPAVLRFSAKALGWSFVSLAVWQDLSGKLVCAPRHV